MEPSPTPRPTARAATAFKWKTVLALILLLNAMILNWLWVFGILIMAWVVSDIVAGRIYFMGAVDKAENPILFWIVASLWLLLGLYLLFKPLL